MPVHDGAIHYPMPLLAPLQRQEIAQTGENNGLDEQEALLAYKEFQKTKWVPAGDFSALLEGKKGISDLFREHLEKKKRGEKPLDLPPWTANTVELHATIDRVVGSTGGAGTLYFEEGLWWDMSKASAMAVLVRTEEEPFQTTLLPALRLISELGIGGNRSVGRNRFEIAEVRGVQEPWLEPRSRRCVLLSPAALHDSVDFSAPNTRFTLKGFRPWREEAVKPGDERLHYLDTGSVLRLKEPCTWLGKVLPYRDDDPQHLRFLLGLPAYFLKEEDK